MTAERTDRELLELAARASGRKIAFGPDGKCCDVSRLPPEANVLAACPWNPLNDDGDTFRLMVALGIRPEFDGHAELAMQDELYRVRRAIVRAAAAMAEGGEQ